MRPVFLSIFAAVAALSAASTKVVIGKLGQTTTDALIYAAPSSRARSVCRVPAQTRLAVRSSDARWAVVMMQNGRFGYVPTQAVEIVTQANGLPWEITSETASAPVRRANYAALTSRGGLVRGSSDARTQMADYALKFEGTTPYKWGGTELGSGIDCSGFVKKMYGAIGLNLPRTAAEQATVGMPVTRLEQLQAGDRLYFYEAKRGKIGHTGIYVGNGYFVHSSSGHKGIAHDFLSERWRRILVAARR